MGNEERLETIRQLEAVSRELEPSASARRDVRAAIGGLGDSFIDGLESGLTFRAESAAAAQFREHPIQDAGRPIEALLPLLQGSMLEVGINPAAPGHLGYIPGGGLPLAADGDYLAALSNQYAGAAFAGPGAAEIEALLVDWMARVVGYPTTATGTLCSGGSLANLVAVVAAREARGLDSSSIPRAVIYVTEQTHHCVDKALRIAGLGEIQRHMIALDRRYRMRPESLARAIDEDRKGGLTPWMIVASAGTTDVGAIDPFPPIADIARAEDVWLHVDAAYGGFFLLCDERREALRGIERCDSIVMDPHKGLFLPYGVGAVIVRNGWALRRAFSYEASYMLDFEDASEAVSTASSPADLSPELSRHFRGLRMWLPLMVHGLRPFRAALSEKLALAGYAWAKLRELGFEVGSEPELSVVTFRWVPDEGEVNEFNRALLAEIHRDGRVFLSSTWLDGELILRLAVLCFRTHLATVDLALDILREKVELIATRQTS